MVNSVGWLEIAILVFGAILALVSVALIAAVIIIAISRSR